MVRRSEFPDSAGPGNEPTQERTKKTEERDLDDTRMATYDECVAHIQQLLSETVAQGEVVAEDVDLIEELGLASLDVMELIEHLEDVFDISFPINELGDVRTIGDLARRVQPLT